MTTAKEEKQVIKELSVLKEMVDEYLDLSKQLGNRLLPVLRIAPSREPSGHPANEIVPLAQAIREITEKVEEANNALRDYLERLEI